MTILVTGATGHLGANLVRALLERGQTVRALIHRSRLGLDGLDVQCVKGAIDDPESLRPAFEGVEVVYHLAAMISIVGDPDGKVHQTNVCLLYTSAMDEPVREGDSGIVDKAQCEEEEEGECIDVHAEDDDAFLYSYEAPANSCACIQHPTKKCRWVNTRITAKRYPDPGCQGTGKVMQFIDEASCVQM